ncbi:hypothetical protein QUF64_10455 [Anaerolineales bacterium HSG6]|nr:hypothetical protein [Anaerolineales bacterium HSG6]
MLRSPNQQLNRALYRSQQFFAALYTTLLSLIGISPPLGDRSIVEAALVMPAQRALFDRMPPSDQRHALAVAQTLQTHPEFETLSDQQALLQAGLLHDMAKTLSQPLPHRIIIVLLEAFWPSLLVRWSAHGQLFTDSQTMFQIGWWRRPFIVHAQHPTIGAQWATDTACDPLAVQLIARHQEKLICISSHEDRLLVMLQWADNLN